MVRMILTGLSLIAGGLQLVASTPSLLHAQAGAGPVAQFGFDGTIENGIGTSAVEMRGAPVSFAPGLDGSALSLKSENPAAFLTMDNEHLPFDGASDFSVQFWMRTVADASQQFVVLSQKEFFDNSLASHKNAGWVFYVSGGTWAWNMGSSERRITYERDNGQFMPMNDGRWHQLTMTYNSALSVVRLFFDGDNKVLYNVSDSIGFDFGNASPLVVGWDESRGRQQTDILPLVKTGAEQLQTLVDTFNGFGLNTLESDELVHLVVDPQLLFDQKVSGAIEQTGADSLAFREAMAAVDWSPIAELESALMRNPYTVHQVLNFMVTAPLTKIYALVDGQVTVNRSAAKTFAKKESLSQPEFDMDDFAIWDRVLSHEEVLADYSDHFVTTVADLEEELTSLTAGDWNIWHGGKHYTVDENGWDSRETIAEILRRENADVVMMQETYSSGDFIAAELGYYFATTVDWDYLNQGSNISVLSRYPIKDLYVQHGSPFMNVGVKVAISKTQDMYVMSNWYGMQQFPAVFEFHETRFMESDVIPTLFAGDFNAVPHTDGGDSPASPTMLNAGFTDAFRSLFPDATEFPGHTHRGGVRIDQLYHKGAGLLNTSTRIVSTWPTGFPSDHYLILSTFDLDYSTPGVSR